MMRPDRMDDAEIEAELLALREAFHDYRDTPAMRARSNRLHKELVRRITARILAPSEPSRG
jgi:ribosomal protein L29